MNILETNEKKKWKSQQVTIKLAKEIEDGVESHENFRIEKQKPMKTSIDRLNSKVKEIEEKM